MEAASGIGPHTEIYNVAPVYIAEKAIISQYAYICTASHDYNQESFPLKAAPIVVGPKAWVAAKAFISPGVKIGEGAVVGAYAFVVKDVPNWSVVSGNPAAILSKRKVF